MTALRSTALAFITMLIIASFGVELATWAVPYGPIGWNIAADSSTISYVTPRGPAARAGVAVGDDVQWSTLPLILRANLVLVQQLDEGQPVTFTIVHNGQPRKVNVYAGSWGVAYNIVQHVSHIVGQFVALFAVALVFLRPSGMTWAFLLSTLTFAFPQAAFLDFGHRSVGGFLIANVSQDVVRGLSAAGILIFVSRFPNDRSRGILAALDRAAPYVGAGAVAVTLYVTLAMLSPAPPLPLAVWIYQTGLDIAITVLGLGGLIVSFFATSGSERQRIIPVLAAYAFFVISRMLYQVERATVTERFWMVTLFLVMALASVSLLAAVSYGIIRHRVIDVSLAVSRTVVYTILTGIVVGAFALVDFLSSKFLEHLQIAIVLEAAVALAFGIWLNALHSRVDGFVDRVLFRRRHLAQARLQRAARSVGHADSEAFVDETLVLEAIDAMNLASAAVFRESAGVFVRSLARGWLPANVTQLDADDQLVVTLRAELQTVDLTSMRESSVSYPKGAEQPLLAVPLVARHRLMGFALYGSHVGLEAIDSDERATLERLCESAAAAYEHLRASAVLNEANELRAENELLRHDAELLRDLVRPGVTQA